MSSTRGNVGLAIVFAFVAVAVVIVLAGALNPIGSPAQGGRPGIEGTYARLAAGQPVPLTPRPVDGTPTSIDVASTSVDGFVSIDQGFPGPSPLSGESGGPLNPPFAGDRRVTSDVNAQGHPSIATEAGGSVIYIAYTNQTTPTNRDVYVARSVNGGQTWTHIPVAANGGYNEFDPRVVVHGNRVVVFFANDDLANNRGFRRAESTDQGQTWTVIAVNYNAPPFRDLIHPDASSSLASTPPAGPWLYVIYETFCDVPASCGGGTSRVFLVAMFDSTMTLGANSVYFPFISSTNVPLPTTEPSIIANGDQTLWIGDADARNLPASGPGNHDVLWIQTQTGMNSGTSWAGAFITGAYSTDSVRVDAAGFQPNFVLVYQLVNATVGFPNHIIVDLYSHDSGMTWTLGLLSGQTGVELKDPAAIARSPQTYATFYQGGDLGFANSSNAGTSWAAPLKVNSNVGSIADAVRTTDVATDPATGPLIAWQDGRDGNPNVYTTGFQRFTVTLQTAPSTNLRVRFDGDAYAAAPVVKPLVSSTTHAIQAESPQSGGTGIQYVFTQWNDGSTANPRTITVSADATYTASFATQYQITVASNPAGRTVTVNAAPQTAPYAFWCNAAAQANLSAPSPQTVSPTSQYRFASWDDAGAQSHAITCDRAKTITATFVLQYQVTIQTNPTGRDVVVAGITQTGPYVFWCDNASSVTIDAPSPQAVGPGTQYRYDTWSDLGAQTHLVTCTGSMTITATFVRQYQVTIASTPTGRTISVNGIPQTAPYASWYDENSNIVLLVPSPQGVGGGTQYSFSAWGDGNVNPSRSVVADASRTFTAIFTTEYFLTMASSASPATSVTPGSGWHPEGDIVSISTTAPADGLTDRYRFAGWTGDAVTLPSAQTTTITMDGPKSITATWNHQYKIDLRFAAGVPGTNFTVDTVSTPAPASLWLVIAPSAISAGGDTRYGFLSWLGVGASRQFTLTVTGPASFTAQYTRQYHVILTITPAGPVVTVDTLPWSPSQDLWFDENSEHVFGVVTPQVVSNGVRFKFVSWSPAGTGSTLRVTMDGPKILQATFAKQYLLTVESSYGTPTCVNTADPGSCWYDENTTAQITVTSPVQVGGAKFAVAGWTGATSITPSGATVMMSGPKTLTANWHEVTFFEEFGLYLGLLIAILVAVIIVVLVLMRRRKKEPAAAAVAPPPPVQGTQAPAGGTKTCPACGMEIPGAATTCPVCGSAV